MHDSQVFLQPPRVSAPPKLDGPPLVIPPSAQAGGILVFLWIERVSVAVSVFRAMEQGQARRALRIISDKAVVGSFSSS
jgi:hypothetical protein